jgi:REP element-mobilizing transposase RayT
MYRCGVAFDDMMIDMPASHFDPNRHQRRSIRLRHWDYRTHAFYFVTICAHGRENRFADEAAAEIAAMMWPLIPQQRHAAGVFLDEWVLMPNHFHGLLLLPGTATDSNYNVGTEEVVTGLPFDLRFNAQQLQTSAPSEICKVHAGSLGAMIGTYKSGVTRRINALNRTPGSRVWQRGYYERIVRNERELERIRTYIRENPARWAEDRENLDALLKNMVYQDERSRPS